MRGKPKDHRPKIVSFGDPIEGLNIAARQNILWPCHAFNISVPQRKRNGLNIFEETVLKLTEIESGYTDRIASITSLDKELVLFIQNRLNHLGLIDNRYNLSKEGEMLLYEWQNDLSDNIHYTVATVFVDLLTGKLLSYILADQINYKKIVNINDNGFIEFLTNPTNDKSKIYSRQIRPTKSSFWEMKPGTGEIIKAIRDHRKKHRKYALLGRNVNLNLPSIPLSEAISVNDTPELVYLHCSVLIQSGNPELLVTDGFGLGFSEHFADYLMSQDWNWILELKSKGIIDNIESDITIKKNQGDYTNKYPEVIKRLDVISKTINDLNPQPTTTAEEMEYLQKKQLILAQTYATLEWSFRYVLLDYPVVEWESYFSAKNYKDNERILSSFAEKVGFHLSSKNKSILQTKTGAIRQIQYGNVELQPLLALLIAGAAVKYSSHPFNQLAVEDSGFLSFLCQLKRLRDPIEHGSIDDYKMDYDQLQQLVQRLNLVLYCIMPSIFLKLSESENSKVDKLIDANQERLKARVRVEKTLGQSFVYRISNDIREQLIRCELMLGNYTSDKSLEIIKCLYSIVQLTLKEVTTNRIYNCYNEHDIKDLAFNKIIKTGFYTSTDDIPKELKTVNINRVHRALQDASTTLGAHLLALFIMYSESELTQLYKSNQLIVSVISNLIRLRGHGNMKQHSFSRDGLEALQKDVLNIIKTIMEVC